MSAARTWSPTTTAPTSSARASFSNWPLLPSRRRVAHRAAPSASASAFVAARAPAPTRLFVAAARLRARSTTREAAASSDQGAAASTGTAAAMPPPAPPATPAPTTALVTVFTTPACPYCRKAKALLQSRSVPYREVDVELAALPASSSTKNDQARALRAAVAAASGGRKTVPQIFIGSAHVGGSDDLEKADLGALLTSPAAREPLPAALAAAVVEAEEAVAVAAAATASEQQPQQPLTLADRAEPSVRAAYLALLEATSSESSSNASRGPALQALAAARKRSGREAKAAASAGSASSSAAFDGEDAAEQRAADVIYAAAASRADPEEAAAADDSDDDDDLAASFSGAELVAALAELQASGALPSLPPSSPSSSPTVALANALVRSNLVNVAGAARRPDPTDTVSCGRFFAVTPTKSFRLLEDTLALARQAAEQGATTGKSGAASASSSPLQLLLGEGNKPPPPDYSRARPLNAPFWWAGDARPASVVAEDVRARVVRLYDRHLKLQTTKAAAAKSGGGGDGGGAENSTPKTVVSYTSLRRDPAFWDEYVCIAAELQAVKGLDRLGRNDLAALAINLYNALVVHALAVYGPQRALSTTAGRLAFFQKGARYLIGGGSAAGKKPPSSPPADAAGSSVPAARWGGLVYTCDDLEHGVLRGNRPGAAAPTMLLGLGLLGAKYFAQFKNPDDPRRRAIVPPPVDARIHFALVCGAQSCPPIRTYNAATLDEGLEAAAEAFCSGSVRVEQGEIPPGKAGLPLVTVRLSKLFGWYYPDFGPTKAERLRWLLPYVSSDAREALRGVLARDPAARSVKLVYDAYDWTANAAEE